MRPDFLGPLDVTSFARQTLAAGEMALEAGQPTDRLLLLVEGRLRAPGAKRPEVRRYEAGSVLCPRSFFGAGTYPQGLRAEAGAVVVHLPRAAVQAAMDVQDPLTWSLARILAQGGVE